MILIVCKACLLFHVHMLFQSIHSFMIYLITGSKLKLLPKLVIWIQTQVVQEVYQGEMMTDLKLRQ